MTISINDLQQVVVVTVPSSIYYQHKEDLISGNVSNLKEVLLPMDNRILPFLNTTPALEGLKVTDLVTLIPFLQSPAPDHSTFFKDLYISKRKAIPTEVSRHIHKYTQERCSIPHTQNKSVEVVDIFKTHSNDIFRILGLVIYPSALFDDESSVLVDIGTALLKHNIDPSSFADTMDVKLLEFAKALP